MQGRPAPPLLCLAICRRSGKSNPIIFPAICAPEKFISGCKRAGEAGALQPAAYQTKADAFV